MLKFVRVAVQRTVNICVINHGEQLTFRDGTQDGFVFEQGFRSGRECECLVFDPRQFIARETPPVFQRRSVSQQYGVVRPDSPDQ